jgi:hypothetical protein
MDDHHHHYQQHLILQHLQWQRDMRIRAPDEASTLRRKTGCCAYGAQPGPEAMRVRRTGCLSLFLSWLYVWWDLQSRWWLVLKGDVALRRPEAREETELMFESETPKSALHNAESRASLSLNLVWLSEDWVQWIVNILK